MAIKKPVGKKSVEKERPSERAMRESEPAFKKAQEKAASVPAKREEAQLPSTSVMDFEADAGEGLEKVGKADLSIPFLVMLQGQSPELETVDGAEAGMFLNKITNELWDEGVKVIPCYYQRQFNRWAPDRQGFRGVYEAELVDTNKVPNMLRHESGYILMDVPSGEKNVLDKDGKPRFDHLQDTRVYFVLVYSDNVDQWMPAILSLSSTQIKKSQNWLSLITGIKIKGKDGSIKTPAIYSHMYQLKPVKQENKKGSWWGMNAEMIGPLTDPDLYNTAKRFHESVKGGAIVAPPPPSDPDAGGDADSRL